jgi:hypothetical protein
MTFARTGKFAPSSPSDDEKWWDDTREVCYNRAKRLFPTLNETELGQLTMQFLMDAASRRENPSKSSLPPAPVSTHTKGTDVSTLTQHVPLAVQKQIRARVTPLSTDSVPDRSSRRHFWSEVEDAIAGLHPTIHV